MVAVANYLELNRQKKLIEGEQESHTQFRNSLLRANASTVQILLDDGISIMQNFIMVFFNNWLSTTKRGDTYNKVLNGVKSIGDNINGISRQLSSNSPVISGLYDSLKVIIDISPYAIKPGTWILSSLAKLIWLGFQGVKKALYSPVSLYIYFYSGPKLNSFITKNKVNEIYSFINIDPMFTNSLYHFKLEKIKNSSYKVNENVLEINHKNITNYAALISDLLKVSDDKKQITASLKDSDAEKRRIIGLLTGSDADKEKLTKLLNSEIPAAEKREIIRLLKDSDADKEQLSKLLKSEISDAGKIDDITNQIIDDITNQIIDYRTKQIIDDTTKEIFEINQTSCVTATGWFSNTCSSFYGYLKVVSDKLGKIKNEIDKLTKELTEIKTYGLYLETTNKILVKKKEFIDTLKKNDTESLTTPLTKSITSGGKTFKLNLDLSIEDGFISHIYDTIEPEIYEDYTSKQIDQQMLSSSFSSFLSNDDLKYGHDKNLSFRDLLDERCESEARIESSSRTEICIDQKDYNAFKNIMNRGVYLFGFGDATIKQEANKCSFIYDLFVS